MEQQTLQFIVLVSSIILITMTVLFVGLFTVFQKKKLEYILRERKQKEEYEKALAKSRIEIRESELKNIAWELHDNVGQLLSFARIQLNMMASGGKCQCDKIQEVSQLIKRSLDDIRSLSKSYNPEVIENIGLLKAVRNEMDRLNKLNFIHSKLVVNGEPFVIEQSEVIILFRIIQESITNIIKHASAKNLLLTLDYQPGRLLVTIEDDGKGFDVHSAKHGAGIINMTSRSGIIGATFSIESDKNGTKVTIEYPNKNIL